MDVCEIDLSSDEFQRDPSRVFAEMRGKGPFVRTKLPLMGECWVTTSHEAAELVLRDSDRFVNDPSNAGRTSHAGLLQKVLGSLKRKNMSGRDGDDHRRVRGLVESAFRPSSIEAMRPQIVSLVDRQLDRLELSANETSGDVDFVTDFARQLPLEVIGTLLGIPEGDLGRLWIDYSKLRGPLSMIRLALETRKQSKYLRRQIIECREAPRPGIISTLVEESSKGVQLSDRELVAVLIQLLGAGYETSVHLLTGGVLALLRHPDQLAKLRADSSGASSAVDEVLRYVSAVQMTTRYAARDGDVLGQPISRGDFILVHVGAANADPSEFQQPGTFDAGRRPNRHFAFGGGAHVCIGMRLAKLEAEVVFDRLFTRFPGVRLALPFEELAWVQNVAMRGLRSLPLTLHPT